MQISKLKNYIPGQMSMFMKEITNSMDGLLLKV